MGFAFPLTDAHVHPDFSIDAEGSVEEYCIRALELGLAEIVFTTHVDTNGAYPHENEMLVDGRRVPTGVDALKRYAEVVWTAKERYHDLGLMVKCGVEIDFFPELDQEFLKIFEDTMFEYILVGIHRIGDLCIGYKNETEKLYEKYTVRELLDRYYSLVRLASTFDIFDAIAHLDYYRRFAPADKIEESLRVDFEFIPETLNTLAETGLAVEVNTSAVRHGHTEYYPSMPLLNMARKAGVRIRYIGSDAHHPDHLAEDFENAELIVYETNVHDISEG